MRTDPSDNGGLFVGRRPGTAPVTYRALPDVGTERRRRFDGLLAGLLLALMTLLSATFWGPIPAAWLWMGSRVYWWLGNNLVAGLLTSFIGMIATLMLGLMLLRRLDHVWILVRRAAGHDQRTGVIGRVFAITAIIGAAAFTFWFLVINGTGSEFAPRQ
jgi:hypothetical protein